MTPAVQEAAFPASVEVVGRILAYATERAAVCLDAERVQRLEVALEEAVVNVCRHAYHDRSGGVVVRIRSAPDRFEVELEDEGDAFDPLAAAVPDTGAGVDERRPGGLGILLMRRLTDGVRYRREDGRNVLTLSVAR